MFFVLRLKSKSANNKTHGPELTPTSIPFPSYPPQDIPQGDTFELNGVKMNNFYTGVVQVGQIGEVAFINKQQYKAVYFPLEKGFLVIITSIPFEDNRKLAEDDFIKTLNISKSDACKLTVYITTPEAYNPNEAGTNFPLSFCK